MLGKTGKAPRRGKTNNEYRSRPVAQQMKRGLFAATLPLEEKKMSFTVAMTAAEGYEEGRREHGTKPAFIHIRKAFFHAGARRDAYVDLPREEATERSEEDTGSNCMSLVTQIKLGWVRT